MNQNTIDIRDLQARKAGEDTPRMIIEELNESLQAGEIEHVAYIFTSTQGEAMTCYSAMNKLQLVGLLEFWKQQLLADLVE
ncbi:hypothetical protein [Paenibacillus donghaensis]|uniref:Uncharacterized protein n=1 Tax=Paenibacillus donghaensis TaxID=414771 RepID=A0A2Z2KE22_9BACL|nr:hypothetical protein [Paenibacillus donghaensis]ASA22105.1 hypothetical protein B9T62_15755 [Paenibacillus donghaensis]